MKVLSMLLCLAALAPAQDHQSRLKPGLYAVLNTSEGIVVAMLYEKYTPLAVKNFVGLAQGTKAWRDPKTHTWVKRPFYSNITFHRIVREEMIQTGDPTGLGTHDCGINLPDEFLPGLRFDTAGRLAVANTGQPNSGGCQFFITDAAVTRWNGAYTIFGQVVSGQDVVHKINRGRTIGDRPEEPVKLNSVSIQRIEKQP